MRFPQKTSVFTAAKNSFPGGCARYRSSPDILEEDNIIFLLSPKPLDSNEITDTRGKTKICSGFFQENRGNPHEYTF